MRRCPPLGVQRPTGIVATLGISCVCPAAGGPTRRCRGKMEPPSYVSKAASRPAASRPYAARHASASDVPGLFSVYPMPLSLLACARQAGPSNHVAVAPSLPARASSTGRVVRRQGLHAMSPVLSLGCLVCHACYWRADVLFLQLTEPAAAYKSTCASLARLSPHPSPASTLSRRFFYLCIRSSSLRQARVAQHLSRGFPQLPGRHRSLHRDEQPCHYCLVHPSCRASLALGLCGRRARETFSLSLGYAWFCPWFQPDSDHLHSLLISFRNTSIGKS